MITAEQPTAQLPPMATAVKPIAEEISGDWPTFRYFFRRFPGGIGQAERYLSLMPSRIKLNSITFDSLGTPVCLFENAE